jgi:GGDEF domain-containing protein
VPGSRYLSATASRAADPTGIVRTETLSEVMERADRALYRAKSGGRNQAVAALAPNLRGAATAWPSAH